MNELALFAGAGGGILGGSLLGWNTVCAVELEPYPRNVLLQRQRDGLLPTFPIWDDVCTFDGRPWRGCVDVVSGGFPCQDISVAGKGAGIAGARSGLWGEMFRVICEVRPRYAFMENSPMLTSRGLGRVLGDLAEAGYNAAWLVLGADDVGAPHVRKRIWILAHDTDSYGVPGTEQGEQYDRSEEFAGGGQNRVEPGGILAHADLPRAGRGKSCAEGAFTVGYSPSLGQQRATQSLECCQKQQHRRKSLTLPEQVKFTTPRSKTNAWWTLEPDVGRVADGVASRVDRLKAIGNGQVPLVAATAFSILKQELNKHLK